MRLLVVFSNRDLFLFPVLLIKKTFIEPGVFLSFFLNRLLLLRDTRMEGRDRSQSASSWSWSRILRREQSQRRPGAGSGSERCRSGSNATDATTTSTASSSSLFLSPSSSYSALSPLPSTATAKRPGKKRKWYKPKLKVKINTDWAWQGFIRAGPTTPTGRGRFDDAKDTDDEWEPLPAYTPPDDGRVGPLPEIEETRRCSLNEWLFEPPSYEPSRGGRVGNWMEPPAYRWTCPYRRT